MQHIVSEVWVKIIEYKELSALSSLATVIATVFGGIALLKREKAMVAPADQTSAGSMNVEVLRQALKAEREEAKAELLSVPNEKSAERRQLRKKVEILDLKLLDVQAEYDALLKENHRLQRSLDEVQGNLSEKKVKAAKEALSQGDPSLADHLFAEAENAEQDGINRASRAAYNRGQIALQDYEWQAAYTHLDRALRLQERFDHYADFLRLLHQMGRYEEGLLMTEKALKHWAHEKENPDTYGHFLNEKGLFLESLGRFAEAANFYATLIPLTESYYGVDHPNTAASYNNLGLVLKSQGDYSKAQAYYEHALRIDERVLGIEHPDTATSYNNLGSVLDAQGEHAQAQAYYECALAIYERTLGEDHPDTARSYNNLGGIFYELGDLDTARTYTEKAFTIWTQRLGPDHPETRLAGDNLSKLSL